MQANYSDMNDLWVSPGGTLCAFQAMIGCMRIDSLWEIIQLYTCNYSGVLLYCDILVILRQLVCYSISSFINVAIGLQIGVKLKYDTSCAGFRDLSFIGSYVLHNLI